MQALLGVLYHSIGGIASGSFYMPYNKVKGWSWESYWIVGGLFSWLIVPPIAAWLTVPGFAEILRCESYKKTPNAVLSRGVSAMRDNTLIINLPGSPKAVRECMEIILKALPHAVEMMRGGGH